MERRERLLLSYKNLLKIKSECKLQIMQECTVANFTVKQIEYLKVIDEHENITFSKLAEVTHNSKPTITELVNKFIKYDCVYKEQSEDDKRVSHILLTEEGKRIARFEESIIIQLVDRIFNSLDDQEIDQLIMLLEKVI